VSNREVNRLLQRFRSGEFGIGGKGGKGAGHQALGRLDPDAPGNGCAFARPQTGACITSSEPDPIPRCGPRLLGLERQTNYRRAEPRCPEH
jgi:hypothetical protein